MLVKSFADDLRWSQQAHFRRQELEILRQYFGGAVRETSTDEDKKGGDYAIDLGARTIYVDVKRRRRGASRFWLAAGVPEIPIEVPLALYSGSDLFKAGSLSTYRLFLFHPSDYPSPLLIPFVDLRESAKSHLSQWERWFNCAEQLSTYCGRQYQSRVVFVPVRELIRVGVPVEVLQNQKSTNTYTR